MMPGRGRGSIHAPALRELSIKFSHGLIAKTVLQHPTMNEPDWVTNPHLPRNCFEEYKMYTVIEKIVACETECKTRENLYDHDYWTIRPTEVKLELKIRNDQDTFTTEGIEPYNSYEQLQKLPFMDAGGRVFGYVFIGVKKTTSIYVAKLYLNQVVKTKISEHVGTAIAAPPSSGASSSSTRQFFQWL